MLDVGDVSTFVWERRQSANVLHESGSFYFFLLQPVLHSVTYDEPHGPETREGIATVAGMAAQSLRTSG